MSGNKPSVQLHRYTGYEGIQLYFNKLVVQNSGRAWPILNQEDEVYRGQDRTAVLSPSELVTLKVGQSVTKTEKEAITKSPIDVKYTSFGVQVHECLRIARLESPTLK